MESVVMSLFGLLLNMEFVAMKPHPSADLRLKIVTLIMLTAWNL
jgi:hypothetical protein